MKKDYSFIWDSEGLEVKRVASTETYRGVIMRACKDEVLLPDGRHAFWDIVHHNGAVCVVPIDNDGNVILVRQYRYPMEKVTLEIPAGKLDTPDEDRLEAAKRELREETGAVAENIICLGDFYGSPAFVDEKITMYAASGLSFGETELDDGEFLTTVKMPLSDAVELVMDGKIEDVKTQAAILRAHLMREQGRL